MSKSNRILTLTDGQEEIIAELVATGRYGSAGDVLDEGLRLMRERESDYAESLEALHSAVQRGFDDIEAGRSIDLDDAGLEEFVRNAGRRAAERMRAEEPGRVRAKR